MKGTILVVDDERSIRIGLKGLLSKEGHEVSTAENGEEALRLLDPQPVDLVLTDLRMPGLNGVSLLRKIKQHVIETFERDFISRTLRRHQGNITRAAEEMGMHRQQLQQKIRELGLKGWEEEKEPARTPS